MKRFVFCLSLLILFAKPAKTFAQWQELPTGVSHHFYNMFALDDKHLFAFGSVCIKSSDAGLNWSVMNIATLSSWIHTGFFVDSLTGWIGGKYGLAGGEILKTIDGGNTWLSQDTIPDIGINDFHFLNDQEGWAATFSGKILHTGNGGINWTEINNLGEEIENIQFISPLNGWASTYLGTLYHTTDGGYNWTADSVKRGYGLFFLNETKAWLTGKDGEVYHSSDGGLNWTYQNTGFDQPLYSIHFADSLHGWAVGGVDCRSGSCISFRKIMASTDGGKSWFPQSSNGDTLSQLNDVCFGTHNAYACSNNGQIIKLETGLNNREAASLVSDLEIFPNPAGTSICIKLSPVNKSNQTGLYSIHGYVLFQQELFPGENRLDLSSLPAGIYFLKISGEKTMEVRKIIKQ